MVLYMFDLKEIATRETEKNMSMMERVKDW
jgi:hypothetical protein